MPDSAVPSLAALAHEVRLAWCGPEVEVEGILSAKTGGCPEDCHFCSQSSKFDTQVQATPFLDTDEVLAAARRRPSSARREFCIVLAVRGPDERQMQRILELVPLVRERTGLNVAVSAGILTDDQARRLAEGGVHRYNHNLETARSYFPKIVTTHTWEERFDTCQLVREHGMELCCGVLLGMGETDDAAPRADRPAARRRARPRCRSTSSTPVRARRSATGRSCSRSRRIRWIALFRLGAAVGDPALRRRAGGHAARAAGHGHDSGINALIVGNYLTTLGRSPEEDLQMLDDLRMPIGVLSKVI